MGRLARKGITGLITRETDPDRAVLLYLQGSLPTEAPSPHGHDKDDPGEVHVHFNT